MNLYEHLEVGFLPPRSVCYGAGCSHIFTAMHFMRTSMMMSLPRLGLVRETSCFGQQKSARTGNNGLVLTLGTICNRLFSQVKPEIRAIVPGRSSSVEYASSPQSM